MEIPKKGELLIGGAMPPLTKLWIATADPQMKEWTLPRHTANPNVDVLLLLVDKTVPRKDLGDYKKKLINKLKSKSKSNLVRQFERIAILEKDELINTFLRNAFSLEDPFLLKKLYIIDGPVDPTDMDMNPHTGGWAFRRSTTKRYRIVNDHFNQLQTVQSDDEDDSPPTDIRPIECYHVHYTTGREEEAAQTRSNNKNVEIGESHAEKSGNKRARGKMDDVEEVNLTARKRRNFNDPSPSKVVPAEQSPTRHQRALGFNREEKEKVKEENDFDSSSDL